MSILDKHHLELLKNQVITVAGLQSITPADCKLISMLVNNKTRHCISETTLKRIYGFALSKFQPSLFTLDALAKFCNFNGWKDFCEKNDENEHEYVETKSVNEGLSWHTLKLNATKITNFTLQALKNRSGIPYTQTIKRTFIDSHLNEFVESGHIGTVITGPAGYGKTIGLCHWIEEKAEAEASNDILLFFSSTALMSVLFCGMDINSWLQALLGYSAMNNIGNLTDKNEGKFYLIIDGFDEHRIKTDQFDLILNQLTDFFSFYQAQDKFKLILTMRSSTWINYRHDLEDENNIWHTNFRPNDDCINMPLFNMNEIKELSTKINPYSKNFTLVDVSESFKNPLYFQLYYKQYKEDFSFANVDHTSEYEINSLFILNKIYLGKYSTEKILLIKKLVESMDFETQRYQIDKLKINDLVRKYDQAYKELLSAGILKEVNESRDYQHNTYIQFVNHYFLTHSIAKILLYSNSDQFDSTLIQKINTLFADSELKLSVLKYCIIHAIKTGQQNSFERLTEINLSSTEKSDLIIFLGDLLNKEFTSMKGNESLMQYFNQDFSKKMFDYFFGIELINNDYKKTLNTLLKFELTNKKKILVYTSLALIAVINLDMNGLEACIKKLKSFSNSDFHSFAVNPLVCLDTLYNFFKYGVIKKEAVISLTQLSFNPPEDEYNLKNCASNDILYLLGMYTMLISNNPRKILRFMNVIKTAYKNDELEHHTSQYGFFLKILSAEANYKLGNLEKVSCIYYTISNAYKKSENLFTPFMQTLFHCLKIKVMIDTEREDAILNEMKCIDAISDEWGSKINKLFTLSMLLKNERFLDEHPNFKKQVFYDYSKIIRNNGLNVDMYFYPKPITG